MKKPKTQQSRKSQGDQSSTETGIQLSRLKSLCRMADQILFNSILTKEPQQVSSRFEGRTSQTENQEVRLEFTLSDSNHNHQQPSPEEEGVKKGDPS